MASPKIGKDIRDYLTTTTGLDDVSIGMLMPSPIEQYAVIVYVGFGSIKVHGVGAAALEQVRVQIQVRHRNHQTCLTRVHAVKDALDSLSNITINGTVYTYFSEVSPPRILATEESGAVIYIWELSVQCKR